MIRNLLLAATLLATAPCALAQTVAITGGRVVTNTSQGIIENGTVVDEQWPDRFRRHRRSAGWRNRCRAPRATGSRPDCSRRCHASAWRNSIPKTSTNNISAGRASSDIAPSTHLLRSGQHGDRRLRIEGVTRVALVEGVGDGLLSGYGALADTTGSFNSIFARDG